MEPHPAKVLDGVVRAADTTIGVAVVRIRYHDICPDLGHEATNRMRDGEYHVIVCSYDTMRRLRSEKDPHRRQTIMEESPRHFSHAYRTSEAAHDAARYWRPSHAPVWTVK